jgi:hypothetical protein
MLCLLAATRVGVEFRSTPTLLAANNAPVMHGQQNIKFKIRFNTYDAHLPHPQLHINAPAYVYR